MHLSDIIYEFFTLICKLACGSHIGFNLKTVSPASTTGVVLIVYQVSLISFDNKVEKALITHRHLSDLISKFFSILQISLWQPYWTESKNCFTCINYRCYVIIVPGFIDFNCAKAEKHFITHLHLQLLNAGFCTFMQIRSRRPFWIESQNCLTCINYRCCVIVVPGFIDF